MFTRKRWNPPIVPQGLDRDVERYLRDLNKSVSDYLLSLEVPDSLSISEASINSTPVGATTADTGRFTTVDATGRIATSSYLSAGAIVFGKGNASLAANSDLDITNGFSGLFVVRNNTDGGTAVVNIEHGLGTYAEVSDPSAIVTVGADPGAGSNQLWVTSTSTTIRVRNRYGTTKSVSILGIMVSGTPS